MLSRSFTAVHTVPSGATARPSPLRTPRSATRSPVPLGLTAMITARCGDIVRSSGLAFDELPTLKYTVPSAATVTSFALCTSSPLGSRSGSLVAITLRAPLIPPLPHGYRSISFDSATYSTHLPCSRANAMPWGLVSPVSRVFTVAVPAAPGRSSTIFPSPGALTRRSPSGVQASILAPGTRAHTRAVQPAGTVSLWVVDSAPPRSGAGTMSGVLDRPAATGSGGDTAGGPDDADAGDEGAAAGCWPEEPEHAVAAATTATPATATVKPRRGTCMGPRISRPPGADGDALEAAQHEQLPPGRRSGQLQRRVPAGELLGRGPRSHLDRAVVAQQLLDRPGDQRRLLPQALPLLSVTVSPVAEQGDGAVPDQVDGRLETRNQQQQRRADELAGAEPVALLLNRHEGGKQAVVGIGAALVHQIPQVRGQGQLRRTGPALGGRSGLRFQGRGDVMAPDPEAGLVLGRYAEQVADHRDRKRERQRVDEVEARHGIGLLQQPPGEVTDPWLEPGYRPRRERAGHQPPDAGVVGRVHREQVGSGKLGARISVRVGGRPVSGLVHRRGAEPRIPQDARCHGVTRRRPDPERTAAEVTPAQAGVDRVRVGLGRGPQQPGNGVPAPLVVAQRRGLHDAVHHLLPKAHIRPPLRSAAAGPRGQLIY